MMGKGSKKDGSSSRKGLRKLGKQVLQSTRGRLRSRAGRDSDGGPHKDTSNDGAEPFQADLGVVGTWSREELKEAAAAALFDPGERGACAVAAALPALLLPPAGGAGGGAGGEEGEEERGGGGHRRRGGEEDEQGHDDINADEEDVVMVFVLTIEPAEEEESNRDNSGSGNDLPSRLLGPLEGEEREGGGGGGGGGAAWAAAAGGGVEAAHYALALRKTDGRPAQGRAPRCHLLADLLSAATDPGAPGEFLLEFEDGPVRWRARTPAAAEELLWNALKMHEVFAGGPGGEPPPRLAAPLTMDALNLAAAGENFLAHNKVLQSHILGLGDPEGLDGGGSEEGGDPAAAALPGGEGGGAAAAAGSSASAAERYLAKQNWRERRASEIEEGFQRELDALFQGTIEELLEWEPEPAPPPPPTPTDLLALEEAEARGGPLPAAAGAHQTAEGGEEAAGGGGGGNGAKGAAGRRGGEGQGGGGGGGGDAADRRTLRLVRYLEELDGELAAMGEFLDAHGGPLRAMAADMEQLREQNARLETRFENGQRLDELLGELVGPLVLGPDEGALLAAPGKALASGDVGAVAAAAGALLQALEHARFATQDAQGMALQKALATHQRELTELADRFFEGLAGHVRAAARAAVASQEGALGALCDAEGNHRGAGGGGGGGGGGGPAAVQDRVFQIQTAVHHHFRDLEKVLGLAGRFGAARARAVAAAAAEELGAGLWRRVAEAYLRRLGDVRVSLGHAELDRQDKAPAAAGAAWAGPPRERARAQRRAATAPSVLRQLLKLATSLALGERDRLQSLLGLDVAHGEEIVHLLNDTLDKAFSHFKKLGKEVLKHMTDGAEMLAALGELEALDRAFGGGGGGGAAQEGAYRQRSSGGRALMDAGPLLRAMRTSLTVKFRTEYCERQITLIEKLVPKEAAKACARDPPHGSLRLPVFARFPMLALQLEAGATLGEGQHGGGEGGIAGRRVSAVHFFLDGPAGQKRTSATLKALPAEAEGALAKLAQVLFKELEAAARAHPAHADQLRLENYFAFRRWAGPGGPLGLRALEGHAAAAGERFEESSQAFCQNLLQAQFPEASAFFARAARLAEGVGGAGGGSLQDVQYHATRTELGRALRELGGGAVRAGARRMRQRVLRVGSDDDDDEGGFGGGGGGLEGEEEGGALRPALARRLADAALAAFSGYEDLARQVYDHKMEPTSAEVQQEILKCFETELSQGF